jgi:alpha-tubulin suppressor-like RCC1 family protein
VNYSAIAGALPTGMALKTDGIVDGTPTVPGTYRFTLAASDARGIAAQTFTLFVSDGTLPNQRAGQYSNMSQGLNDRAFAALRPDGTITTWGDSLSGGAGAAGVPTQAGFVQIAQTARAFAALRYDGSIQSWGNTEYGGGGAPTDAGYSRLFSNGQAFAALKPDGSIYAWGDSLYGGSGAPTGTGYRRIFINAIAMVAMKADGSLSGWGYGGSLVPAGTGYVTVTANGNAFAALKADGSISAWGSRTYGGKLPSLPTNNSYTALYANENGFAALRADGTLATWGAAADTDGAFTGGSRFISAAGTALAFAALKSDGTVTTWGNTVWGGCNGPTGTGFTQLFSTQSAFVGLKTDGSLASWGNATAGGNNTPVGTGYSRVYANTAAFTAVRNDGTLKSWGDGVFGGGGKAPPTSGFTQVFSTPSAFVGQKNDGSLSAWGDTNSGGSGAPTGTGLVVSPARAMAPYYEGSITGDLPTAYIGTPIGAAGGAGVNAYQVGAQGLGNFYQVTAGALPKDLSLDPATGFLSGTPAAGSAGVYPFTITSRNKDWTLDQTFTLEVKEPSSVVLPNQREGNGAVYDVGSGQSFSNQGAFIALRADGSISAWGNADIGGSGAPAGSGYTQVVSNYGAFAALKKDGSISVWGHTNYGGSGAPSGSGYTQVFSSGYAFAALKVDGSISAWGDPASGGTGAPTDTGYTQVFSNTYAFAALKADGSISVWGSTDFGGSGAPTGTGYTQVFSTNGAFAALKADGSISAWGDSGKGGTGAPTGTGYTQVFSTAAAFAALKANGSITAWGHTGFGGSGAPIGTGYIKVFANLNAFAAVNASRRITAWGDSASGGTGAPISNTYTQVLSTGRAFAALKADGSITAWGDTDFGGSGAPTDTGYTRVFSTGSAFAALRADGSITAWGHTDFGGSGAPTGTGYTQVVSNYGAFAAMKADGSITVWGDPDRGGSGAPTGTGFVTVQTPFTSQPVQLVGTALTGKVNQPLFFNLNAQGVGSRYELTVGSLPAGVSFNPLTGVLSGTPTGPGTFNFTLAASTPNGVDARQYILTVTAEAVAPVFTSPTTATFTARTAGTFTVEASGATSYAKTSGTLPYGLTLNSSTGVLSGTPAAGTGGVRTLVIRATNATGSTDQTFTLTVNQAPVFSAGSASLNTGVGHHFSANFFSGIGVLNAYPRPTFSISGTLPTGFSFSDSGMLVGPAAAGSGGLYNFALSASNGVGSAATALITLKVGEKPVFTSANTANFVKDQAGSFTVAASGYPAAIVQLAPTSPALPVGLTLNTTTGVLSGTPTGPGGGFDLVLRAQNGGGATDQNIRLNVAAPPVFTSPPSAAFTPGSPGLFQFTASGYPAPTFSTASALPSDVTLAPDGTLSGTTSGSGSYPLVVNSSNSEGTVSQSFTLSLGQQPPAFTSATTATFMVGVKGRFSLTATGSPAPTYSISSGTLPAGLTLEASTGIISGTPAASAAGSTTLTVRASNGSTDATQTLTLAVNEIAINDSGQTRCLNLTGSNWSTCSAENVGYSAPFAGLDARFGRDPASERPLISGLSKPAGSGGGAGFAFIPLDATGTAIPLSGTPAVPTVDPRCVRDTVTGLTWEVKTPGSSGLQAVDWTYAWSEEANANGPGTTGSCGNTLGGDTCSTANYVKKVNESGLCGLSDWRLPTTHELLSIVDNGRTTAPAIAESFFPYTAAAPYWSQNIYLADTLQAWALDFSDGKTLRAARSETRRVRLVRP